MASLLSLIPDSVKRKIKLQLGAPHIYWSIENLKRNGFAPKVIADVGAYEGEFTTEVYKTFPDATFYMFEANPQKEAGLKEVTGKYPGHTKLFMNCLGSKAGQDVSFHLMETASSVLDEHFDQHVPAIALKTETLDNIFSKEGIVKVDMIKLDVQGYEVEILKGFEKYLPTLDVIVTEVSLLDIHKGVPLFRDVVNFMYDYGFVAYDICSVSARRPLDQALWQTDLIFVKENSAFRADKRYA
ncbi:FkbM family methyltransferase [Paraflavitalea soli]|uniref:FkbM family methyltransferase n=1 Tax=Paraflavitalea soli TaxID=2315862 RepID=A0A3B7MUP0_9BACT|nr:FkbM family methyltransferase [Paraflavitalea soli]AXY77103.1 FkbM family methyltransferase [Paraflavitalea soli]